MGAISHSQHGRKVLRFRRWTRRVLRGTYSGRLERLKVEMLAAPDQQISLTEPDARSMATSGRGSGLVGYNVQIAVEANHHLIVMHEVTNDGTDRSQLVLNRHSRHDEAGAEVHQPLRSGCLSAPRTPPG